MSGKIQQRGDDIDGQGTGQVLHEVGATVLVNTCGESAHVAINDASDKVLNSANVPALEQWRDRGTQPVMVLLVLEHVETMQGVDGHEVACRLEVLPDPAKVALTQHAGTGRVRYRDPHSPTGVFMQRTTLTQRLEHIVGLRYEPRVSVIHAGGVSHVQLFPPACQLFPPAYPDLSSRVIGSISAQMGASPPECGHARPWSIHRTHPDPRGGSCKPQRRGAT